jgi:hypothetical protein
MAAAEACAKQLLAPCLTASLMQTDSALSTVDAFYMSKVKFGKFKELEKFMTTDLYMNS